MESWILNWTVGKYLQGTTREGISAEVFKEVSAQSLRHRTRHEDTADKNVSTLGTRLASMGLSLWWKFPSHIKMP